MRLQLQWYGRVLLGASLLGSTSCAPPTSTEPESPISEGTPGLTLPARSADSFVQSIGVNTHLSYFQTGYGASWTTIVKPRLLELGIRHLRDGGSVVASDGWMETVYGRMNELAAAKIKFNLILKPADGSTDYTRADHLDRLLRYASGVVESFEGLNEHDNSGRATWVAEVRNFQHAVYGKLKQNAQTASLPLLGPAMAHPANMAQVGDLSGYMNYGALHPYPGGQRPMANVATHVSYGRKINGSRPLVITESGYHTATLWTGGHPPVAPDAEARYVPRAYLDYYQAGFARTYLYELLDEGTSTSNRELSFGLLQADGTPKPAFLSLKNLITVLADPGPPFSTGQFSYTLSGDTTNVRRLLLQKRDGRFDLVLWHDAVSWNLSTYRTAAPSAKAVTLTFAAPAGRVQTFAILQSPQASRTWTGAASLPLTVPDSPLVVEITP